MSERVFCYVDGYNLYRSVRKFVENNNKPRQIWYDLVRLCQEFTTEEQTIKRVYYCSAPYRRASNKDLDQDKLQLTRRAHAIYCRYHQRTYGKDLFRVKFGYFIKKNHSFEEKQTDVNIGLLALDDAHRGCYDHAFILSGDGDLAPIANHVHKLNKNITFVLPPDYASKKLSKFSTKQINGGHIKSAQFNPGADAPRAEDIY